jgi:hypothetical protein
VTLTLAVAASADVIHVPGEEATIGDGLGAASPGDTVLVECDTYYENGLVLPSGVTLMGATGDTGCVTIDGGRADVILTCEDVTDAAVVGIGFTHGSSETGGAAYSSATSAPVFVDCDFDENSSTYHGGAFQGYNDGTEFYLCEFTSNRAEGGGAGAALFNRSTAVVSECSFYKNEASWGGAIGAHSGATLDITWCTFAENDVPRYSGGAGLYIYDGATATIDQTIIAFNTGGEAVKCTDGGAATLTCSDVFGNDLGDWVDCIAGQEGTEGNLNVNPLFCDIDEYDLTLCADSACLPALNDCNELMGVWPEGCPECGQPVESVSWGAIKGMYR